MDCIEKDKRIKGKEVKREKYKERDSMKILEIEELAKKLQELKSKGKKLFCVTAVLI